MRNITDAFTNNVSFSQDQVRDWLPNLLAPEGKPPTSFWPTYFHEATHHWCFSSPVQTTIALLTIRSQIEIMLALEATTQTERDHWEQRAAEDIFRSETVQELMRPLAEGLATFAEFDLNPTLRGGVLPAPLRWAARFAGLIPVRFELPFVRLSDDIRRRKESLLAQPLSCQDSEGYLAGYLTVKMLWHRFKLEKPDYWTSSKFLQAAYHDFYEDEDLVALLLEPTMRAPDSLQAIGEYVGGRIQGAFRRGTGEEIAAAHRATTAGIDTSRAGGPLVTEEVGTGFAALWRRTFAGVPIGLGDRGRTASEMARSYTLILHSRDLMLLGSVECNADVRGGQATVTAAGAHLVTLPAGEASESEGMPVTLRLYLGTRGGQRVVVVVGDDLLCYSSTPEWTDQAMWATGPDVLRDKDYALRGLVHGRLAYPLVQDLLRTHRDRIRELRMLNLAGNYRAQTRRVLDQIYRICTMLDVPKSEFDNVWERMRTDGFYGLLDRDADAVRALAVTGILSSGALYGGFSRHYEAAGLDRTSTLAALQRHGETYRMFRLVDGGNGEGLDPTTGMTYCSV